MSVETVRVPATVDQPAPVAVRVPARAGRPMRTARMVTLRSSMPVQLVTLRHQVPLLLDGRLAVNRAPATPKVEPAVRVLETAAGKGDAR